MRIGRQRMVSGWCVAMLTFLAVVELHGQGFDIGGYQVVSSNRVGRTVWEYVLRVTVTNRYPAAQGVTGQVASRSTNTTTVVQGAAGFGDLASGAGVVSTNTIVIRQDRLFPFDPSALRWAFSVHSMALQVSIDNPASELYTNGNEVLVSGLLGPGVATVEVSAVPATLSGNRFSATVPLREGRNTLSAVARNSVGGLGSATVNVHRDTTAPLLNVEQPSDGAVVSMSQVTVVGMINDVVLGTVNSEQCHVSVNGVEANVANRSYEARDVVLSLGTNILTVLARDRAGNTARREIRVIFRDPAIQQRIVMVGGNNQSAVISTLLPEPLTVAVLDNIGNPVTNQPVTFRVVRNDGLLKAPPLEGREVTLRTDDNGLAAAFFQLGTRTGAGNNQVAVSSPGFADEVVFCSSATVAPAFHISALVPETQVGEVNKPLPQPWTVMVFDQGENPVASVPITFIVFQGEGYLNGSNNLKTLTISTDGDGRASVAHTLGSQEGLNNNQVVAMVVGLSNSAATFTATARVGRRLEDTRVVGVILDNVNRPMSNILCHIEGTALETTTDGQGQFVITNAPVGAIRLFVDARNRGYPGEWHALEFDLVTVAGRDNSVDRPIFMLPLDGESAAIAGGDEEVVLRMKEIPGATLTIAPHSLRDASGRPITNRVMWTQVNLERVPMPPPLGSQFMLAWTVQPAGLHFDPPASICIPNMGSPPGQQVEIFSFDHDLVQFVAVGTATVFADGSQMCSDAGFGVTKSGWGGCLRAALCSWVCGKKPQDTECTKYVQTGTSAGLLCNCPIYEPRPAKFELGEMKLTLGGNELMKPFLVCTGDTTAVSFSVEIKDQNCPAGLEYEWEFTPASAGDPATLTDPSVTKVFKEPGKYAIKVTVKCMDCPSTSDSRMVDVEAFGVELDELTFGGPKFDVYRDQTPQDKYPEPHWKKGRSFQSPVAYVRNAKMELKATFKVAPASLSEKIRIKTEATGGFKLPEVEVSVSGGKAEYAMTAADSDFPDMIGIFDPMEFKWMIGPKRGDFCFEEKAQLQVYTTRSAPRPKDRLFHTLLHLGCTNAVGLSDEDAATDAIYGEFTDQSVSRVNSTTVMKYWDLAPSQGNQCYSTAQLLNFDSATCQAWADFFDDMLKAQGILSSEMVEVRSPGFSSTNLNAAIARELPPLTDTNLLYTPIHPAPDAQEPQRFYVKLWTIPSDDTFNITDLPGIAGQGNPNPPGSFCNHGIVRYGGKYYDPSYGTAIKPSPVVWENDSIDGFGARVLLIRLSTRSVLDEFFWVEKRDPKGSQETRFIP